MEIDDGVVSNCKDLPLVDLVNTMCVSWIEITNAYLIKHAYLLDTNQP